MSHMLKSVENIKITTYNTLLSRDTNSLVSNIIQMANDGTMIFCLQEVTKLPKKKFIIDILLKDLGPDWKAVYNLGEEKSILNFGTSILWNSRFIQFKDSKKISLPSIDRLAFYELVFEKLIGHKTHPVPRRSIVGVFQFKKTTISISSLHLDNIGGTNHRMK